MINITILPTIFAKFEDISYPSPGYGDKDKEMILYGRILFSTKEDYDLIKGSIIKFSDESNHKYELTKNTVDSNHLIMEGQYHVHN